MPSRHRLFVPVTPEEFLTAQSGLQLVLPEERDYALCIFEFHQFTAVSWIGVQFRQPILDQLQGCFQFGSETRLIDLKQRVLVTPLPNGLIAGW